MKMDKLLMSCSAEYDHIIDVDQTRVPKELSEDMFHHLLKCYWHIDQIERQNMDTSVLHTPSFTEVLHHYAFLSMLNTLSSLQILWKALHYHMMEIFIITLYWSITYNVLFQAHLNINANMLYHIVDSGQNSLW